VSGRVLLSVREHFANRALRRDLRLFPNRKGRAWVTPDTRDPLDPALLAEVAGLLDSAIGERIPSVRHLVVDPAILGVALPLSGKAAAPGLGVLPRGSVSPLNQELLRFFIYWRQHQQRTDLDLSTIYLNERFAPVGHVSYTSLRALGGWHSGDITDPPPEGATEMIDLNLPQIATSAASVRYIVPQVYVYSGEGFDEVDEVFFGYMSRGADQLGQPYEPRTVRMKSDLRGSGKVAAPLIFVRADDGTWQGKWMHLYTRGHAAFNQVEGTKVTASLLAQSIVQREYLPVRYMVDQMVARATAFSWHEDWSRMALLGPVTYIGLEVPEGLPEGSRSYTLRNLAELIPA
jgi:hypothetical protein